LQLVLHANDINFKGKQAMNRNSKIIATVVGVAIFGAYAYSQLPKGGHDMAGMSMAASDASPSTKAFEGAMAGMMKGMMATATGKPDLDFAQGMIPHHQGAIDMAKVVLQYGKDPDVKKLAEDVVKAQEGEIIFLKDWLAKTDQAALPVSPDSTKANDQAMAAMMKNMMMSYTGDADVDFLKSMIPHHQGAIDMAKVALQYAKDPALLKLAQDIVTAQEGEITFMKDWLAKHGK
jgi:uncharacterized protein (DUF305 family)